MSRIILFNNACNNEIFIINELLLLIFPSVFSIDACEKNKRIGLLMYDTLSRESYDSLRIQKSSPIYIDLAIVYKQSPEKDIRVIKGNDIYVSLCSLKRAKFHTIFAMIKNQE